MSSWLLHIRTSVSKSDYNIHDETGSRDSFCASTYTIYHDNMGHCLQSGPADWPATMCTIHIHGREQSIIKIQPAGAPWNSISSTMYKLLKLAIEPKPHQNQMGWVLCSGTPKQQRALPEWPSCKFGQSCEWEKGLEAALVKHIPSMWTVRLERSWN